jgi:hypothetical protein
MTGDSTRAVSTAITHPLTLAITALLISTLLFGAGELLADQKNRAAREQLSEIGSDVVSQIEHLDSLNGTGESVNASVRPTYPDRVAGEEYSINITGDSDSFPFETSHAVSVDSPALDQPVQFPVETEATLDTTASAQGAPVEVCLRDGTIDLGRDC